MDWSIAARAINDASSLAWFGLALAPAYGGRRFATAQMIAGVVALLSLAAFAAFAMIDIAGPGVPLGATQSVMILGATSFGHVWLLRAALCVGGLFFCRRVHFAAVFAGLQLAILGFAGHAFARGGVLGASIEGLHLLAAGAWVGGVIALALQRKPDLLRNSARFSKPGYIVASIAVINGNIVPAVETPYGWLAAAKLALFLMLLALACANRFYALPRGNVAALRAGIAAELVVMAALSLTAATLATTSPAM
jgi:putative copper resistance protein D